MIELKIDVNKPCVLGIEDRATITGLEKTMFVYVPGPGCRNDCLHCSIKHIRSSVETTFRPVVVVVAKKVIGMIKENSNIDTMKVFNGGNILRSSDWGKSAELHTDFWEALLMGLSGIRHLIGLRALELEVSPTDLATEKVRSLVAYIRRGLSKKHIELRLILGLEYAEADGKDGIKFRGKDLMEDNLTYLEENGIPYLVYAMCGGGTHGGAFSSETAVCQTIETIQYLLGQKYQPREIIVNCQYTDPLMRQKASEIGRKLVYVPTEEDLKLILCHLRGILRPKSPRIRFSYHAEDVIVGSEGPVLSKEFEKELDRFNADIQFKKWRE